MISPIRVVDLDEPSLRAMVEGLLPRGRLRQLRRLGRLQAERDLLLEHLAEEGVANVGALTGDIHSFWQAGVRRD